MSFCYFSKDFINGAYTSVENKFIVKYMPQAEDVAVKVYLYGLFLCQNPARDFSIGNCAEVLKIPTEKIVEAFEFWEDCDLVQIICREPFTLEYLPIGNSDGRPKKIKYEKYADFNKELQRKMQAVGVFLEYPTLQKYMNFLQANEMEQQAFLLIAEYCIQQSGVGVAHAQILNKAKNFIKRGLLTYSQVEKALSDFNVHTADVKRVLVLLGAKREPDESDYALFSKWINDGFEINAVIAAAKNLKRGNMQTLDGVLSELSEHGRLNASDVEEYLNEKDMLCNLTFKIARNLGLKISSPLVYIKEYTGKWYERGYEEKSLCALALLCVKTERNSFSDLDELLQKLYTDGVVSDEGVQEYLKVMQRDLKLLSKIQSLCGTVRKSEANLNMLDAWRKWSFSEDMIVEAAKRAANTSHPLPYMNKILSDWKRKQVFKISDIPQSPQTGYTPKPNAAFVNANTQAIDERTDRERYYAERRAKAEAKAERFEKRAMQNGEYKAVCEQISTAERESAKAEAFNLQTLPALLKELNELKARKTTLLTGMGILESDLIPQYSCKNCSDSGFLPDGRACACYQK
ncbi:MAG: DnaD domain protein [Clostridia bacterium]|nr:DnaD domain protein [Clostridia bacterium]